MKIGDRIYVHGYVDEIRKDTVIVRNDGGYFGTIPSEVITGELPSAQPEIVRCKDCRWHEIDINQCGRQVCAVMYDDDFCSLAERKEGEEE